MIFCKTHTQIGRERVRGSFFSFSFFFISFFYLFLSWPEIVKELHKWRGSFSLLFTNRP
jgi:uncharacterized membrane protein